MKKLITTCCIVGAFASASQAQIKLGLKLSPQITWVAPESKGISSGGSKINASYGLMFDYYFTENYAFATEISVANYAGELIVQDSKITHFFVQIFQYLKIFIYAIENLKNLCCLLAQELVKKLDKFA